MKPANSLKWYNPCEWGVEGKGWNNTERYYDRLPPHAKKLVPEDVWRLSRHSAGLSIQFETDSAAIYARWILRLEQLALPHMPATSVSGLDLYGQDELGNWGWVAVGRPETFPNVEVCLNYGLEGGLRRYKLYLPLHNEIESVEIGVQAEASFVPIIPSTERPIVFYGTSIIHGIAASRAGMCYPAILGRRLNRPTINLGFSGRGKMEQSLARLLGELAPCVYVIDCLPNMEPNLVEERAEIFVKTLREIRPNTPIILVEDRTYTNAWIIPALKNRNSASRAILCNTHERLTALGDKNLYYVPGKELLGDDDEATVDGTHPTDLGFIRMANILISKLTQVLSQEL